MTLSYEQHKTPLQHFLTGITLGEIIQTAAIIGLVVGLYYKQDARLSNVESVATDSKVALVEVNRTLRNLDETLGKLGQRLDDFPLHRHIGSKVIYPAGITPPEGTTR